MIPLAGIGFGLSAISSIGGMLGASAAQKRAEEAKQKALLDLKTALSENESHVLGNNQRAFDTLAGQLRTRLEDQGGNLGQSLANAGVYNSSVVGGALARQSGQNAQALGDYGAKLDTNLQDLHNQNLQKLAGMQYGDAQNSYNIAHQKFDQAAGGFKSLIGAIGSGALQGSGAVNPNTIGAAVNGKSSVLDINQTNPWNGSSFNPKYNVGGYF